MIGTSTAEWIFIRIAIVIFRYTPLFYAAALSAQFLRHGSLALGLTASWILAVLLLAEGCFYVFIWQPYQQRLKVPAKHPEPLSSEERHQLFQECLENVRSLEAYLRGWFLGAEIEDIRRDNLKDFLLWAFFDKDGTIDAVENDEKTMREIDEYVSEVERRLGRKLDDGRGSAESLRLTLDDAQTTYRSLGWYIVIFLVDQAVHLYLDWHGFQYHASSSESNNAQAFPPRPQSALAKKHSPAPDLSYWFQPHEDGDESLPVVFFHGIGVGLLTYIRFLVAIHAKSREGKPTGIIAIEILPISFRLTAPPLDSSEFVRQMSKVLSYHNWKSFNLVSHSYGSVLTTHMLRDPDMQRRIPSTVLIDPVSVLLHLPNVAYNFTRRSPKGANEWQLWYFASTDPGVAHCLSRHFFWRQNIIWRDQLAAPLAPGLPQRRRVAVCLAGRDLITDVATVAQYLTDGEQVNGPGSDPGPKIEVAVFPELDHAQAFDNPDSFKRAVALVKSYCAAP